MPIPAGQARGGDAGNRVAADGVWSGPSRARSPRRRISGGAASQGAGLHEHAVALEELALAADSGELEALLERMAGDVGRRQGWQLDSLDRLDADKGGTNRSLLDAARENQEILMPPGQLRRIRDMFDRVSPVGALYSVYSRLSEGSTHAGLGSAAPYLESAVRAGTAVPAAPDAVPWAETAALLCWSCCAAEDAMLRFIEDGVDRAAGRSSYWLVSELAPG